MTSLRDPGSRARRALGAAVTLLVAVVVGWLAFTVGPRESTSEYPFLVTWSIPPALAVYVVAPLVRGGPLRRAGTATLLGIVVGLAWAAAALVLSGGYLLAADFPVLWCWIWGAVVGLLVGTTSPTRQGATAALAAALMVAMPSGAVLRRANAPPLVAEIVIRETASAQDIEAVWSHVLGDPHPGGGHSLLEGISSVSRSDRGAIAALQVTFDAFASRSDSARVQDRLRASPVVAEVRWTRRQQ